MSEQSDQVDAYNRMAIIAGFNPNTWRGDLLGGLVGTAFIIPTILGCGAIAFLPLGDAYLARGLMAAFSAAVVVSAVLFVIGGRTLHINAPRTTQAALLAALMVQVAALPAVDAALAGDPQARGEMMIAVTAAGLLVAGLIQIGLGLLRLGDMVKFVPFPIIAGFVNGFVVQIVLGQLPFALGQSSWAEVRAVVEQGAAWTPWPIGFAFLAGTVAVLGRRLVPGVPGSILGLAAGTLGFHAIALGMGEAGALGPVIGRLPADLPIMPMGDGLMRLVHTGWFAGALDEIVATGITLGFIASVQSLLSATAADAVMHTRHDSNRELLNQGVGNVASALLGGTASGGSLLMTRMAAGAGGRTRLVHGVMALGLLAFVLLLGDVIAAIPRAVIAGVVIVMIIGTIDDWTIRLVSTLWSSRDPAVRRDLTLNLGILLVVSGLVAFVDVLAAIGIGMLATVATFLHRSSSSAIRRIYFGDQVQSNTARANREMDQLDALGRTIAVVELHGPVFFGSADRLAQRTERAVGETRFVILDFQHVNDIDSTGALILKRLDRTLAEAGTAVLLAGLPVDRGLRGFVTAVGYDGPERDGRIFDDVNAALSFAEDRLLEAAGQVETGDQPIPLKDHESLVGLTEGQYNMLELVMRRLSFAAGTRIYQAGDPADSMYFLVSGQATRQRRGGDGRVIRQAGYRAGAIFGELALIRGGVRVADVVADTDLVCYQLEVGDMSMMYKIDPRIPFILARNISRDLNGRVEKLRAQQWAGA